MDIPSHRAAAVQPTPAQSFELRRGQLVNLDQEAAAAAPSPAGTVPAPTPTPPVAKVEKKMEA